MNAALDVLRVLRGAYSRRALRAHARGDATKAQVLYAVCCDLTAAIHLLEELQQRSKP